MTEIKTNIIECLSCRIHYLSGGRPDATPIVLLHGMKFQAATWKELGTLNRLAEENLQAIALDMPGFGLSPSCSVEQDVILTSFFRELGLRKAVLLGPSMGGRIALEFTLNHPELVRALVLAGAVGVEENRSRLPSIAVPTLLVWGSNDAISPPGNCDLLLASIPGSKKIIIEGASHPCYLDNPDTWHRELSEFLRSLPG